MRLLNDQTFETVGVHRLSQQEMACSVNSVTFRDDPSEYYVVGTAYVLPDEMEPCKVSKEVQTESARPRCACSLAAIATFPLWRRQHLAAGSASEYKRDLRLPSAFLQGRILILRVDGNAFQLVSEKETRGAVYNVTEFQGKLLAGINGRLQLYG